MSAVTSLLIAFSVLFPTRGWYAPDQPLKVSIKGPAVVSLMLLDFSGKPIESSGATDVQSGAEVDVSAIWPQLKTPGTYLLFAVEPGKSVHDFSGTPLVINVLADRRSAAVSGAMVTRVEPLQYAKITTDHGPVTVMFYYDVAPVTCDNFIRLSRNGFYDGLLFHRIIDGFIVEGGDPRGDGTGGPGYHLEAEFSSREHREGAVSMARQSDPIEAQGSPPRGEFANSAGSQFFICVDYDRTKQLDGRYTVFAQVISGMDAIKAISKTPTDAGTAKPTAAQTIQKIEILPATAADDPYGKFLDLSTVPTLSAATQPNP